MSAFVVDMYHLHVLLTAGLSGQPSRGPLSWRCPETEEPDGPEDYQTGEPWGASHVETLTRTTRTLTRETADCVGFMLLAQNYASVNFRYEDKEESPLYRFRPVAHLPHLRPVQILKALACYEYQSCETPDWEQTEAHAFCEALRHRVIGQLPGYDDAGWDLTPPTMKR